MSAPRMPRMTVMTRLMFCLPGSTMRARTPMTAPNTMRPRMSPKFMQAAPSPRSSGPPNGDSDAGRGAPAAPDARCTRNLVHWASGGGQATRASRGDSLGGEAGARLLDTDEDIFARAHHTTRPPSSVEDGGRATGVVRPDA